MKLVHVVSRCRELSADFFGLDLPSATLADVASWLIQNDTQLSMTMRIQGKKVWNTK